MSGGDNSYVTQKDLQNNPGVGINEIKEVKEKYHFHKLASVTLHHHTLICTFQPNLDPTSIFYTPLERGVAPVREYKIEEEGDVELMKDGLGVRVGEQYISSEEIWAAVPQQKE